MSFRFEWYDESRRAMRYIAEGDWNWRDYQQAARAAAAHVRSFTRVTQSRLTGRVAVIGMPDVALEGMRDGVLRTANGLVRVVVDEAVLAGWAANPPAR